MLQVPNHHITLISQKHLLRFTKKNASPGLKRGPVFPPADSPAFMPHHAAWFGGRDINQTHPNVENQRLAKEVAS